MFKKVTPLVLIMAVSACSTPIDRRQANDVAKYGKSSVADTSTALIIPEGLKEPNYSNEYKIPALGPKANPLLIGESLDIRPPLQVLPMAEGTRVEESSDSIKVVIESIDPEVDLKQEIFEVLNAFMRQNELKASLEDYEAGVIETDWIEDEQVLESSLWGSDTTYSLRQRYRFDVTVRAHGRSGSIAISLIDHQELANDKAQEVLLSGEDKRRYTVDMLNSAIQYMGLKRKQLLKAKKVRDSMGISVNLEQSQEQGAYWVADAKFEQVWDRLRTVLPELGFEILDLDQTKGLYHVDFTKDSGFWSSLWSDSDVNLEEGNYRVLVEAAGKSQTHIFLRDNADGMLDVDLIKQVNESLSEQMEQERKVR